MATFKCAHCDFILEDPFELVKDWKCSVCGGRNNGYKESYHCNKCSYVKRMRPEDAKREWTCPHCGTAHRGEVVDYGLTDEQRKEYTEACAKSFSEGRKFDNGKLRYDLIPADTFKQLVEVITYGAKKYEPNNWQKVEADRYIAALFRHFESWRMGEQCDEESGLHHLAHAMCNIMFLLWKEDNQ